jgi:hypothetical protein
LSDIVFLLEKFVEDITNCVEKALGRVGSFVVDDVDKAVGLAKLVCAGRAEVGFSDVGV